MNAVIIGISSGIVTVFIISLLKFDKPICYALILSGIGFLYVGFTWTDIQSLVINCIQAIAFLLLAYLGLNKNTYFLIAGYFLHGLWDIVYDLLFTPGLIPPHYDLFCLSIDFTMGLYLLLFKNVLKINLVVTNLKIL